MFNNFFRFFVRVFAFVRKETLTIFSQPRLLFSLILGPFFILLIFGIGYRDTPRTLRTLLVIPEGSTIVTLVEEYATSLANRVEFIGITSDADSADRQLRNQSVDLVVVTPFDPMTDWEENQQATFALYHAEVDPFETAYIQVLGDRMAETINKQVLLAALEETKTETAVWQTSVSEARAQATAVRQALESGDAALGRDTAATMQQDVDMLTLAVGSGLLLFAQMTAAGEIDSNIDNHTPIADLPARLAAIQNNLNTLAGMDSTDASLSEEIELAEQLETDLAEVDALLIQFQEMEAQVLVAPFRSETFSVAPEHLDPTYFYVPAVIALLLQHIAITLASLSIIGEKRGGSIEFFQVAPVSVLETLLGKFLSFLLVTAVLAAVLTILIIYGLGMPMLGSWGNYVLAIVGVLCASLGIGFLISLAAQTDSQAIQYAMIILLASIFFSGFFLPLYRLAPPVHVLSWLLPATYGTQLLQSIMLRGQPGNQILYLGLLLFGSILFIWAWLRLRRQMARL
ncbi:MAG TPA: ABC transporter permease [Chloroflexota bacterium]|nr:ABC transporter permease [Chloroflexota bacterium]HUM67941.1 ABC transporter permease [Chloroflexota bacterium]